QQRPDLVALERFSSMGRPIMEQFQNNEELFPLLVKEAQAMGVGVSTDILEAVLARRGLTHDDPAYESMRQALRSVLMVTNAASRACSVVKVSRPEVTSMLASQRQEIALNLIEFNARD